MRPVLLAGFLLLLSPFALASQTLGQVAKETPDSDCAVKHENSSAPNTRSGRWIEKRKEKFNHIQPRRLAPLEKTLLWVEEQIAETISVGTVNEIEESLGLDTSGLPSVLRRGGWVG